MSHDARKATPLPMGTAESGVRDLRGQLLEQRKQFESLTKKNSALADELEDVTVRLLRAEAELATAKERDKIARVATMKSFETVDPAELIELVTRYDALDQTRAIARDYASRARAALEPFPDSAAKEALDMALDFVLERDR